VLFLVFALTVPFLGGCSTLGIATLDDLDASETRLRNSSNATATRIDELEKDKTDLQQTLTQITTSIDTLNARFARASEWLQTMNLDTISEDAEKAQMAAMGAEARSRAFLTHYLEWIRAQHAALQEQITLLEAKLNEGETGSPGEGTTEKPAESGGDDESSSDSGG
jgi:chromosome segregation ATPase